MYRRNFLLALTPLFAVGGVASYAALKLAPESFETTAMMNMATRSSPAIGGPFELVDHLGRRVTDRTYRGRLMLIYFGYTGCPDICPANLGKLATALDLAGADTADNVAFLFITVDPARDTPAHLADYVGLFHPQLAGLSGSEMQCAQAAAAYHIYRHRLDDRPNYSIDHSDFAYLVGRDGQLVTVFSHATEAEWIAQTIRLHL